MTPEQHGDLKIDLRQIGYFIAIAECGSITRAAARLGITQPSLSEAVARLERDLGAALVLRTGRGVVLTRAGAALAAHGRVILGAVQAAVRDVRQLGAEARGPVSLGLTPTLTSLIGVPLAETVAHEHPEIQLLISEGVSPVTLEGLSNGRLDLGVCYEGHDFGAFEAEPLWEEELFLLSAPDDWPDQDRDGCFVRRPLAFRDLAGLPLILPNRPNGMRNLFDRIARSRGVELKAVLELNSLGNAISIVTRASAHAILSHAAVVREAERGELVLVPITDPPLTHTAFLLRRKGQPVSSASQLVERLMIRILGEMIARYGLRARLLRGAAG